MSAEGRSLAAYGVVAPVAEARPNALRELIQLSFERSNLITLAGGLPAEELFDAEGLEEAARRVFRSNARKPLQYDNTEGLAALRGRLAALCCARGVAATASGLIVTSGSQQAIDLAARCLVAPGDAVLVERPTFITALQTFRVAQARLLDLEDDGEGPGLAAVEAALAAARAEGRRVKFAYLVPSFSNPAGRVISERRRRELIGLAARENIVILEDDPYGELWFDRPAPPPMAALAGEMGLGGQVLYVSSLSKLVAPGLRTGWIVLPPELMQPFRLVKSSADIHSNVLAQATVDAYLETGRLEARMDALRRSYRLKAEALAGALAAEAKGAIAFERPSGGMFLWARLPGGVAAQPFSRHALTAEGVAAVPGDPFYADAPETDRLRLSFSQGSPADLAEAARRLARALESFPG